MAYLELHGVSKIYSGEHASVGVRKVSLAFDRGEFVAITGASGAGKTTLLNILGGLENYDDGEMYIDGAPSSSFTARQWQSYHADNIAFIFQNYQILESFTALENVEFALMNIKDRKRRRERAREILARVGLSHRENLRGSQLSGGEKQRTVIARAIAKDCPVILADEPTGNLDSAAAAEILKLLKEVSAGKLVVIVTHGYDDVKEYATRHIRMYDGEVASDDVMSGERAEFCAHGDDGFASARAAILTDGRKKQGKSGGSWRDGALLGVRRFASRPRQSALIATLLSLALIGMMCVVGLMSYAGSPEPFATVNPIVGRVIVAGDADGYTRERADALAKKYGASAALIDDVFLDRAVCVDLTGSDYVWESAQAKIDIDFSAQTAGEVVLSIPHCYRGAIRKGQDFLFGETTDSVGGGVTCTVVDVKHYADNRKPVTATVSPQTYALYAALSRHTASLATESGGASTVAVRVDFSLVGNEAVLYSADESLFADGTTILFSGEDKGLEIARVERELGGHFPSYGAAVAVSPEFVAGKLAKPSSKQISLFFPSKKAADGAANKLRADGIHAVTAHAADDSGGRGATLSRILRMLSGGLLTLVIGAALAFTVLLTLKKLILATKSDVAVFRTMGISDGTVKRSTYVQLALALIPACAVGVCFFLITCFTPLGRVLPFIGVGGGIALAAAVVVMTSLLAGAYNRALYRERVKKGLGKVNK